MKQRILIWIIILITPTTLWFLFASDGREAFQLIFNSELKPTETQQTINLDIPDAAILIPATTKPKQAAIMVYIKPAVAGAVLIDSKNRKAGFNSITNERFVTIPNASVQQKDNSLVVKIEPSAETLYQLHITNREENKFNLSVRGISPSGETLTQVSSPWIQANRLVIYDIDLNKVENMPLNSRPRKLKGGDFITLREQRVAVVKKESLDVVCHKINNILISTTGDKFKRSNGEFSFGNNTYRGCKFYFADNTAPEHRIDLPSEFYLGNNSQLAKDGWIQDTNLAAGGPDGSLLVIRKQNQFCVISERHDGGVDDDPTYVPSNEYSIDIECSEEAGV